MEDIVKVVLHTPSIDSKFSTVGVTYKQYDAIHTMWCEGNRLTLVGILDREELRIGVSICNTKKDQFSKKEGIKIATKRALVKPIYHTPNDGDTKYTVLERLKDMHMHIGNNLKEYKRVLHGVV